MLQLFLLFTVYCILSAMQYFLAKTDPDTYSIDDLAREGVTAWDGVHNYAAIAFIKRMRPGDQVFIYESLSTKAIVGLAEVAGEPYENKDDTRFSWAVHMKFIKKYKHHVTLAEIKQEEALKDFALVRQSRLSTMIVPDTIAYKLLAMLGK